MYQFHYSIEIYYYLDLFYIWMFLMNMSIQVDQYITWHDVMASS